MIALALGLVFGIVAVTGGATDKPLTGQDAVVLLFVALSMAGVSDLAGRLVSDDTEGAG